MRGLLLSVAVLALMACLPELKTDNTLAVVPVTLNVDPDHGTCSGGWRVNTGGARLHSGPGSEYPVIGKYPAGKLVADCNTKGGWVGIIDGQDEACDIGIMISAPRPYTGPCPSGWIENSRLTHAYG